MKNSPLFLLITLILLSGCGQDNPKENLSDAIKFLKEGNLDKAKELVDAASESESYSDSAYTWYYKGYIYNARYKKDQNSEGQERIQAIDYFKRSLDIDSEGKYAENCRKSIINIAKTYYNDAVIALNSKEIEKAVAAFDIYLEKIVIVDPDHDLKLRKVDVYLAMGGMYTNLYQASGNANKSYFEEARSYFDKVLVLDKENLNANYNMGILYYNDAVQLIREAESCKQNELASSFDWSDSDAVIPSLEDLVGCLKQADFKKYKIDVVCKKAVPYLEKANELEPSNKNTLIGLDGLYYALEHYPS